MPEEAKQEKCCCCAGGGNPLVAILKVILGLAFLVLGCLALLKWRGEFLLMIKGSAGLLLFLAGAAVLAMARE